MSRLNRILISISLVLLISLGGCDTKVNAPSNKTNESEDISYEHMGREVLSPVDIPYVIDNPIEVNNINLSENDENQRIYFQISGLKDKDIEKSINDKIKSLFEEMLPYANGDKLPPYRGIKSAVGSDWKIHNSSLSVSPQFNSNNILSVVAFIHGGYNNPGTGYVYFSMTDSLNFDLNTGEEFILSDVFTNDVNGLEIVNDAIINQAKNERLRNTMGLDEYANFALVAPFKGINNDQKFYITNYGISVIIDYDNLEFDTKFSYNNVVIPLYSSNGHIAITERFYDGNKSIYTKDPYSKRFIRDYNVSDQQERKEFKKGETYWNIFISYPKSFSKTLIDIIKGIEKDGIEWVNTKSKEKTITYVEQSTYSYITGSYVNVSCNTFFTDEKNGDWQERNYVYSEDGKPIALEDLFVSGYDYMTIIKESIDKTIKDHRLSEDIKREELLNSLMFKLEDTSISFVTKPYELQKGSKSPLHFNVTFEEIGYKNLVIFD